MGRCSKSHTLDLRSSPPLLEIIRNDPGFHPRPDSALWHTLFARGCSNTEMASSGQGVTRVSWDSFQNLEGHVPWQVFALGLIYSSLPTCVCLSPFPCLPNKTLVFWFCSSCLTFCLQIHISHCHCSDSARHQQNKSLSYQVSFWQCSFYLFVQSLWLHFFLQMASLLCSQRNWDQFLIARINFSSLWIQPW